MITKQANKAKRAREPVNLWALEAFQCDTGRQEFSVFIPNANLAANPLFTQVQIGPDREIFYNSISGLVRFQLQGKRDLIVEGKVDRAPLSGKPNGK